MKSLYYSYNMQVEGAYIIRIKNHQESEELAKGCAESCEKVGMPYQYWDAYNGTGDNIIVPDHHSQFMNFVKITDHYMTRGEVACALSHISLWAHCLELDQPIVILEHDSLMLKPYVSHSVFNSICYLGSHEQMHQGWPTLPTPPHGTDGPNFHFIGRAHAYAIDPSVAKNLLAYVLQYGITAPLDIMMRADIFPMHQMRIFAYDRKLEGTTIKGRPKNGRQQFRNDKLVI